VKQTIYEVTGISDIVRGASKANETATAQQIKGQWAGLRISTRQKRFADFARDLIRLKAEVIAERFDPQTLSAHVRRPAAVRSRKSSAGSSSRRWRSSRCSSTSRSPSRRSRPASSLRRRRRSQPPSKEQQDFYAQPTWEDVTRSCATTSCAASRSTSRPIRPSPPMRRPSSRAGRSSCRPSAPSPRTPPPRCRMGLMPPDLASSLIKFAVRAYKVGSEVEQVLEELGQNAVSPQNQQAQKQIQEQQQALQKQQAQVQQDTHASELKKKDSDMAAEQARHAKEVFDLVTRHHASLADQQAQHEQQLHQFAGHAEQAVRDAINPTPQQ
jgi:hypothetical protein